LKKSSAVVSVKPMVKIFAFVPPMDRKIRRYSSDNNDCHFHCIHIKKTNSQPSRSELQ
jgi:hypothetical protein